MFGGKKVVGLDIGSHQVKVAELRRNGSRVELVHAGVADVYPNGDRSAAAGSDPNQLRVAAVQKALASGKITARHSVCSVSGESIIVRYIQLPEMPEADMKNALRWEAEEYIPFSIDEVNLDSAVLGPSAAAGKVDVLLVAARKDIVNDRVQLVRAAGLVPVVVDVEGFAFLNCFEINYQPRRDECVCLVHIGADVTNINIYIGQTSRFSRDIAVAGNSFTQAVAQKCGIPWGKAEELKMRVGLEDSRNTDDSDGADNELINTIRGTVQRITGSEIGDDSPEATASKAISGAVMQLVSEIRRSIQFFEGQGGGTAVQKVIIGGGSSRMKNLANHLSSELDSPVEVLDPFKNITIGRDVDPALIEKYREQLAAAVGLALRKTLD